MGYLPYSSCVLGHFLGSVAVTTFPSTWKGRCVPCRLFYIQESHLIFFNTLGSQLPLWQRKRPQFIRVGMVLYVWLIELRELKWRLVCENELYFRGFWEVVLFALQVLERGERQYEKNTLYMHQNESFTEDKTYDEFLPQNHWQIKRPYTVAQKNGYKFNWTHSRPLLNLLITSHMVNVFFSSLKLTCLIGARSKSCWVRGPRVTPKQKDWLSWLKSVTRY